MRVIDQIKADIKNTKKDIAEAKYLGDESWLYERVLGELQAELKEWEA